MDADRFDEPEPDEGVGGVGAEVGAGGCAEATGWAAVRTKQEPSLGPPSSGCQPNPPPVLLPLVQYG